MVRFCRHYLRPGTVSWYHGMSRRSLYTVKQILLSASSVAICDDDDALPNSGNLLIFHLFAPHRNMPHQYGTFVPHLAKDINKLENIQRRSARFVNGDYRTTSSVTQMLQELGWQDLQSRRRDLRLAYLRVMLVSSLNMLSSSR